MEVLKDELFARARATEFCFDFAHGPTIVAERRQKVPPKVLIFYLIKLLPPRNIRPYRGGELGATQVGAIVVSGLDREGERRSVANPHSLA